MVREAEGKDAAELFAIITESLGYTTSEKIVRENIGLLSSSAHTLTLVYEDDASGRVQGFLHALRYDTLHRMGGWDVVSLAVSPDAQGRGVGKGLLCAFEQRVVDLGGSYVRLNSRVERTDAHGFYEHLGYTCDKQQKRFIKQLTA